MTVQNSLPSIGKTLVACAGRLQDQVRYREYGLNVLLTDNKRLGLLARAVVPRRPAGCVDGARQASDH